MRQMTNKKSGFTIMETMISMGIFSLILGALYSVAISQNNFLNQCIIKTFVAQSSAKAITILVKELRLSNVNLVMVFNKPIDQPGVAADYIDGKSVFFQLPVDWDGDGDFFDAYGSVEWGAEGNLNWALEYCWDSANNHLLRRVWDENDLMVSDTIIAENISGFRIQGLRYNSTLKSYELHSSLEMLDISITSQKTGFSGQPVTLTLSNKITWHN